jgi:hypothetical protein
MQDERVSIQKEGEQAISPRTIRLIEYLDKQWQRSLGPSSVALRSITEFLVRFPDVYKMQQVMAMTKIAESLIDAMCLHFLNILATFQEKAEQEGIDAEEREALLRSVLTETFPEMMSLSRHVTIQSIDDLVTLSNITHGLYTLSQVSSAEEALSWMFELPALYRRQLAQGQLLTSIQAHVMVSKSPTSGQPRGYTSGYIAWNSALPAPAPVQVSATPHQIMPTLA